MVANAFYENVSRHKMEGRELQPYEKRRTSSSSYRPQADADARRTGRKVTSHSCRARQQRTGAGFPWTWRTPANTGIDVARDEVNYLLRRTRPQCTQFADVLTQDTVALWRKVPP